MAWDWIENALDWADENQDLIIAGTGILASYLIVTGQADASEAQQLQEAALTQASNEQRERLERWNRGDPEQGGTAVLPLYFGEDDPDTPENESFEANLGQDIKDIYLGQRDQLNDALAFGDNVWAEMQDSYGMGNQFIEDVFSGELAADRQALVDRSYGDMFAGVNARLGQARGTIDDYEGRSGDILDQHEALNKDASKARRAAINTSLGDRLKEIQFNRQRLGFGGGSSFSNNLATGATIGARQAAAMGDIEDSRNLLTERQRVNEYYMPHRLDVDKADLDNFREIGKGYLNDTMFGYDKNFDTQRGMLDAPMARTLQAYDFGMVPLNQEYRAFDEAADRLDFFRISGGTPGVETPSSYYVPTTGEIIGSAALGGLDAYARWRQANDDDDGGP